MEVEALVAAATLAVAAVSTALLAVARALPQPSTVAAFEQRRLSGVRILRVEVSADQLPRLDSIITALGYLLRGRAGSLLWATDQ
jgi:hypothetical protein